MIYFFNDRKLAAELRDGLVPSIEKFYYFMLSSIWLFISTSRVFTDWMYEPATRVENIADFVNLVIGIVALCMCYDVNRSGDDRDFIERVTCIGWPAFVRMIVLAAIIGYPPLIIADWYKLPLDKKLFYSLSGIFLNLYLYYRMVTAMKICAARGRN